MHTYLVNIVFRIEASAERIAQFDEQVRIIKASSTAEAYEKALYLGLAEEGPVNNINGSILYWTFAGITGLTELSLLDDKSEIFSSTRETALPQAYLENVREKQQNILFMINQFAHGAVTV